jgi:hypothetical protein
MKKTTINVPANIRFMSQWKEFSIPDIPHIMNKQIPGCGFTEYCITNNEDVILCSPRKILLQNKFEQHKEDVYLVVNTYDQDPGTDKDLTKEPRFVGGGFSILYAEPEVVDDSAERETFFKRLTYEISDYIDRRRIDGKPVKILVTYDSFKLVKDIVQYQFDIKDFRIVVDEFQSIFTDSKFKSDTELGFMDKLRDLQRVCYVSATPMIRKYLDMLDEFKDLPYYVLDWGALDPGRLSKPNITVRTLRGIFTDAKPIIERYLSGNFEFRYVTDSNGGSKRVESREAVFYVNSVNNITSIIKRAKLTPEQVNILIASTTENEKRIRKKLGKKFEIGKVPLRGEPRKMFTFCTRTVYLGADFYSDNARTFIISDANIDTLAVDITLDLPQIMGRQRLSENPWKDEATLYFKSVTDKNVNSKDCFDKKIAEKDRATYGLMSVHKKGNLEEQRLLSDNFKTVATCEHYKKSYVAVNTDSKGEMYPVFNHLVRISELRAFEIQQVDYANRFSVFSEVDKVSNINNITDEIKKFLGDYEKIELRPNKLKFLCENYNKFSNLDRKAILANIHEKRFREFLTILGPSVCKSCGYNVTLLYKKLDIISFDNKKLISRVISEFEVGKSYSNIDIKERITQIYKELDYKGSPKASDLNRFFNTKSQKVRDNNNKRLNGLEIISKKEEIL